jgi:hypothetical protein
LSMAAESDEEIRMGWDACASPAVCSHEQFHAVGSSDCKASWRSRSGNFKLTQSFKAAIIPFGIFL